MIAQVVLVLLVLGGLILSGRGFEKVRTAPAGQWGRGWPELLSGLVILLLAPHVVGLGMWIASHLSTGGGMR